MDFTLLDSRGPEGGAVLPWLRAGVQGDHGAAEGRAAEPGRQPALRTARVGHEAHKALPAERG